MSLCRASVGQCDADSQVIILCRHPSTTKGGLPGLVSKEHRLSERGQVREVADEEPSAIYTPASELNRSFGTPSHSSMVDCHRSSAALVLP